MTDPTAAAADHSHHQHAPATGVLDPVCGMTVDPHKTPHRAEHAGHPRADVCRVDGATLHGDQTLEIDDVLAAVEEDPGQREEQDKL